MLLIWRRPASGQEDGPGAALPSVRCSGSSAAVTGRRQRTLRRAGRGRSQGKDTQ
jgi:hypothetical protein